MRREEALLIIVTAWAGLALAYLTLAILMRRVPPPTATQQRRLEAFLNPAIRGGGGVVWSSLALGAVWLFWRRPLPEAAIWLAAAAWGGLFFPSWCAMWFVRWWFRHAGARAWNRSSDGSAASGGHRIWFRVLPLLAAGTFIAFILFSGPRHALRALGFGVGTGLLSVLAAIVAIFARRWWALVPSSVSLGLFGITVLSYLFTRDLQSSVVKFAAFEASLFTTGSFLVLLYGVAACFTALVVVPVFAGVQAEDPACRRLYLIHVVVLLASGFYLLPAVIVTGLLTAATGGASSFEEFWEAHFFHTPWLLAWQLASWLLILVLVRRVLHEPGLKTYLSWDGHTRPRPLAVFVFLLFLLGLGTVTEIWRGFWLTWTGTAVLFILITLDLWHTWGFGDIPAD